MSEGISIVICCYNSSTRLKPTLEHLYLQKEIPTANWEIVLVDNASTDDTVIVATDIWNSFTLEKAQFKIVYEGKPGLSAARIKGINESRFKYILFCDDDNWLDRHYLYNAWQMMESSLDIGVLGGHGIPIFEGQEPPYFWKNQFHILAVGEQWNKEGDITKERGVVYGAGMVLNKVAFNTLIDKFNFDFQVSDRIGNSLMSSGDHELCLALRQIGYKIYYSRSLQFKHFIPEKRTTLSYYKNLFTAFGKSDAMLLIYSVNKQPINSFRTDYRVICLRCFRNIIKHWFKLAISGYYLNSNKYMFIDNVHGLYNNIGFFKRMLIQKNAHKKIIKESPLFKFQHKISPC